jgi:hypothetical protein
VLADTQSFNVRNTSSLHWRAWLKPENRCLVPANSFAEYAPETNPDTKKKDVVWFALNGSAAVCVCWDLDRVQGATIPWWAFLDAAQGPSVELGEPTSAPVRFHGQEKLPCQFSLPY